MMHYFKQYGARRSGTNYLRALLEQNIEHAIVLMHTLGDKHNIPVDLKKYLSAFPDDALGFVKAASDAIPAENSSSLSYEQLSYLTLHASALTNAVLNEKIHFLISIKNPYAWINSMFKNVAARRPEATETLKNKLHELIRQQCADYNNVYSKYWEHFKKHPHQTTIVRYEDLIENPDAIINNLLIRLNIPVCTNYTDVSTTVFPTDWDQVESKSQTGKQPFDRNYYLEQRYMHDLDAGMISVLEEEIDWTTMHNYGYQLNR